MLQKKIKKDKKSKLNIQHADASIHYLENDPIPMTDDRFFRTEYEIFSPPLRTGPDVTKEFLETIEKENKNNNQKAGKSKRKYRSNKKRNSKKIKHTKRTKKYKK